MSELITIAYPYAKAAFDFAVEHNEIESWQTMLFFSAKVSKNYYISQLVANKSIRSENIVDIFMLICGDHLNIYGQNLIHIMAKNQRLVVLPYVLHNFVKLRAKYEHTLNVNVYSINTLNQTQIAKITTAIEQRLSHKVKLHCKIDQSLIAGLLIHINDMVIDGSVRGRLKRLTKSIAI